MAGNDRNLVLSLLITARDAASGAIRNVRDGVAGIRDAAAAALEPLRSFGVLIAGAIGIGGGRELVERADAYTRLTNQIKVATQTEDEYRTALQTVVDVANRANADLETTAALYSRISIAGQSLNLSQQQTAELTELISKGMQLSGASAQEYASATLQLTQAFNSGVLRGEEFNAVMEASPELMRRLAAGLGVAVGELRGFAEAGQLSASRVSQALLSQKDIIDEVYSKLPLTVDQALTKLSSASTLFVGRLNEQTGATKTLVEGLQGLAKNMDAVAAVMGAAFVAATAKAVQSMSAVAAASITARKAAQDQAIAAAQQQAANLAAAQSNVAAAQAAYNRALAEQRATQAQLAAIESLAGLFASEEALIAARAQATAAANAATAATQRYTAAQTALATAQGAGGAAASVSLFSRVLGVLAGPGGLLLAAVSSFALLFGAFSRQKTATDDLAQSTEQYAASLEKLNAAQLSARLLDLNQAIEAQEAVLRRARFEARDFNETYTETGEVLLTARTGTEEYVRAQAALADETGKLTDLQAKREEVLGRLTAAEQAATAANLGEVTALNQRVTALDKLAALQDAQGEAAAKQAAADQSRIKTLLDRAKAESDLAGIERQSIALAQQRATAAEQAAKLAEAEAIAAGLKVTALESLSAALKTLTPAEEKSLQAARDAAAIKDAEARASRALADALNAEADSTSDGLIAKQRQTELAEKSAAAARGYTGALEQVANAQLSGIRAEIDLARAKGDTITASRKSAELAQLESRWAQTLAAAKQAEIAADRAGVQAKIAELQARNDNSQAVQLEIASLQVKLQALGQEAQALQILMQLEELRRQQQRQQQQQTEQDTEGTEQNTKAVEQNTQANESNAKSYTIMEDAATGALKRLSGLSAGMNELIRRAEGLGGTADLFGRASDEAGKLQQQLDRVNAALAYNAIVAKVGYDAFERNAAIANQAQKAYLEQAVSAERLAAALGQATDNATENAASLQAIIDQAQLSRDSFDLLDQARLDNLQKALDAANEKLREMQQEADDARARLAELNAEIAAERGDTATADRLKLQLQQEQALAEIEAKIAQARAEQNQELIRLYEEQKQKLLELYALKEKNLEADIKANQAQRTTTGSASSGAATTTRSGGESAAAPSKVYQLNLVGTDGKTLSATTTTDPESFLGALSAAKARSLA